ncbi:VOC family protein [Cellulomonas palmilytica]|uniref:VOC family protein n=1 Tax=Cellulomonas palmilytica TaxID=2608402 RepID=UPI00294FFC39|nr:VOC family protein [Cellulomonas palmilytica]
MLFDDQIAAARPPDWRKLAQGLHTRYLVDDLGAAARFLAAVAELDDAVGTHLTAAVGPGRVDLKLVSPDAIYRDEDVEHVVEYVTQQDLDLAERIAQVAAEHGLTADPASVASVELGLDTARSGVVAPVWAALLTGDADSQGRGSPSDEVRDASGRVPNLWFGDLEEGEAPAQRWHVEVYVAPEAAEQRVAAAVAAGGTVTEDSRPPGITVVADQDGNTAALCVAEPQPSSS